MLLVLAVVVAAGTTAASGQLLPPPSAPRTPSLPEPVYWKQNLFLIPYQWSSASDVGGAQAVWLFVSKDGGVNWQKISEAKPQVRAFTYRAEQDGEYWFAIRTIDRSGHAWPEGPYQPELRVIVDTTMPRVDELAGSARDDGTLEIRWGAFDLNVDPASWKIEVQTEGSDQWHAVPLPPVGAVASETSVGRTTWTPPAGGRPTALRSVVYDRAGNAAVYGTKIEATPVGNVDASDWPTIISGRGDLPPAPGDADAVNNLSQPGDALSSAGTIGGWVADSVAAETSDADAGVSQPWPASTVQRAPFRLFGEADLAADTGTTYGRPTGVGRPLNVSIAESQPHPSPLPAGEGTPKFVPLEPFREASLSRLPGAENGSQQTDDAALPTASDAIGEELPPIAEPKWVGSRTFALEYELEEAGRWGVSKVEVWGSRDEGQTWRCYATDDDNRSPVQVTVDSAGVYGFRIVVCSTDGTGTFPPAAGDLPELWVAVDLDRPRVELTSIEPGSGELADHLVLRWHAEDDNLRPRPISLFYSSRPAGPWSALATELTNTGEYAWRLERHVPARFYLRLEARDTAANVAAYQTAEPVLIERPQPTGRIRDVRPVSSASSPSAAVR